MKVFFDHCFTPDPGHRFLARLRRAGFTGDARTVSHPGGRRCRFVFFGPPVAGRGRYLEFVSAPRGVFRPGLSLRSDAPPRRLLERMRARGLAGARLERRAGPGGGPGWTFVWPRSDFAAMNFWFTRYDAPPGRRRKAAPTIAHRNGCGALAGLRLEVNAAGRRLFAAALGRRIGERVVLDDGVELTFARARRNRLRSVVLRAADLPRFRRLARPDEVVADGGRPAARFANPSGSWEVLVV